MIALRIGRFLLFFCFVVAGLSVGGVGSSARAQEVVETPICFKVRNTAEWTILGDIVTDYFTAPNGQRGRHRANFRLGPGEEREICTRGPFYPGRKQDLTLRTIVPIFSCRTRVDQGDILIKGARGSDGRSKTWAICFE